MTGVRRPRGRRLLVPALLVALLVAPGLPETQPAAPAHAQPPGEPTFPTPLPTVPFPTLPPDVPTPAPRTPTHTPTEPVPSTATVTATVTRSALPTLQTPATASPGPDEPTPTPGAPTRRPGTVTGTPGTTTATPGGTAPSPPAVDAAYAPFLARRHVFAPPYPTWQPGRSSTTTPAVGRRP